MFRWDVRIALIGETKLNKKVMIGDLYTQVPSGWTSEEFVVEGTVRVIDGKLHHAWVTKTTPGLVPFTRELYTLWVPVRDIKEKPPGFGTQDVGWPHA